ncbi:MAG TPA: stage II sporulation protein M [Methanobacteriaceae archaeon]|nr:stage II sporulation protein M [Methanobacteriaceae archaeon]
MKKPSIESFKRFIKGFIPSKYALTLFSIFFSMGFLLAFHDPVMVGSNINGGFLLGDIQAQFDPPQTSSLSYLVNQFIFFLGVPAAKIFLSNVFFAVICIFSGILIVPIILLDFFSYMGSITYLLILKVGLLKAFLILLGSFHLYLEFLATILVIDASLKFYGSIFHSIRQRSFAVFKKEISNKFIPLFLRIILLLALAAFLEVFWSTWWVYIMTHTYISWADFYVGVYSCLVK